MIEYISLAIMVVLTCCGQMLIKKGAVRVQYHKGFLCFLKTFSSVYIITGAITVLSAPFFYIFALTKMKLSVAYTFTGFNYILVLLGSWFILKEKNSWRHIVGILFIFAGILIFNIW